jgi:DNA end-binding protein Ku
MKDLGIETSEVSDAELKLATQLIGHLAVKKFNPGEFTDEFKARVQAAIRRKVEGKEVSLAAPATERRAGNVVDLMQALKASLNGKPKGAMPSRTPKRASPPASRRATRR